MTRNEILFTYFLINNKSQNLLILMFIAENPQKYIYPTVCFFN